MKLRTASGEMAFKESGTGETVVLLHGYLETGEIWDEFAESLSRNFRIIQADLPGHGGSDLAAGVLTMELMAESVKNLLAALEIKKCFLAGHSMGGYVTLAFAGMYPAMLTGYSLLHSHPYADSEQAISKRNMEISLIREGRKEDFIEGNIRGMYSDANIKRFEEMIRKSVRIASAIPPATLVSVLKGMMERPSRVKIMEEGNVPGLWMLGRHDNYIQAGKVLAGFEHPANLGTEILEHSGHMGFIEEPGLTVKILTDYITGL